VIVWIGLTEVSKGEGCEIDFHGVGAFIWWATQADSREAFLRKLDAALKYYRLVLLEVSNIGCRDETSNIPEEIQELVERAMENENWVLFGTFHSYSRHNA
jgi:hypothetical protein